MLTPEEERQLAEARSLEELENLLLSFYNAGRLTEDEYNAYWDTYEVGLPDTLPSPEVNPQGGAGTETYGPEEAIPPTPLEELEQGIGSEAMNYLRAYTSKKDLADRIAKALSWGVIDDEETAGQLYNVLLGIEPSRTALDRVEAEIAANPALAEYYQPALQEAQREYEADRLRLANDARMLIRAGSSRLLEDLETEAGRQQEALGVANQYIPYLKRFLDDVVAAGSITQEQADTIVNNEAQAIMQGTAVEELPNYAGVTAWREANPLAAMTEAEQAQYDIAHRSQVLSQHLGGLQAQRQAEYETAKQAEEARKARQQRLDFEHERRELLKPLEKREGEIPKMPGGEKVLESYLGRAGAEGTRLRDFIAGRLGEVITPDLQQRRARWWQRMHAPAEPTYGERMEELQTQKGMWEGVLGQGFLPGSAAGLGDPDYWKPGGLGKTAQAHLAGTLRGITELEGQKEELRYTKPKPARTEDPFVTALKGRGIEDWRARYMRQPGVGPTSRLAPALRFR